MKELIQPAEKVVLTDEYCKNALEREIDYLLSLEPGRLLAGFYENAGLSQPYLRYGGWESKLIGGHTIGHYLSALAHAVSRGGARSGELLSRLQGTVDGLCECQEALGSGLIWGAPLLPGGPEVQFDHVEQGKTNIKSEAWVPWYTLHKILAGLLDAYRWTGYAPAQKAASALGDWVAARVSRWDKRTQKRVLAVEYGGMNDALYSLYSYTKNPEHARAAHIFDEESLFEEILTEGENVLTGLHANTTIPKILGALNRYLVLDGEYLEGKRVDARRYLETAQAFFRMVTERHTYITGGNSEWEHFGYDYVLDKKRTNCNCETCNVYNMLKLARRLFRITGDKHYMDYYDTAFTNSILSSQNPETGMTTYFQPMASGFFKVFSKPYDHFWCCTGSGMESFSKLGDSAFFSQGKQIWIEQYLSAEVETADAAFTLQCNFPLSERGILRVLRGEASFGFRVPDWADGDLLFGKNGIRISTEEKEGHVWVDAKEGDFIIFAIPLTYSIKGLPDGGSLAFRYGGAVLSADLGTEDMQVSTTGVDVVIPAKRKGSDVISVEDVFSLLDSPASAFEREGETFYLKGKEGRVPFRLHYKRYRERYAIYLHLKEGDGEQEEEKLPYDAIQVGYGQYECDALHDLMEFRSVSYTAKGTGRSAGAGGWFSYDMKIDPRKKCTLSLCLREADNGKTLKISAEGETLFEGRLCNTMGEEFYSKEIPIPASIVQRAREKDTDGASVTVLRLRFEGIGGRASARVCDFLKLFCE